MNKQKIVATAILLAIFLTLAACGPVVAPEVENGQTVITEYIRITAAEAKKWSCLTKNNVYFNRTQSV